MQPVYVIAGVRTAIGSFGGSLIGKTPAELGGAVISEALSRASLVPEDVGHVVLGQVAPTAPEDAFLARVAAIKAGLPVATPALTVNRLCGSGVQSIVSASQMIQLDECGIAVAGGAEIMSRVPFHAPEMRFGKRLGNASLVDALVGILSDPFEGYHMGVTAENVAADYKISREDQDALAAEGHRRAAAAIADGRFEGQIMPVALKARGGERLFAVDEHVRGDTTVEALAALKPIFAANGTVTAGNASGINDGAAAVVLASGQAVADRDLRPMARIVSWGYAGVEPRVMGIGPIKAVPIALERAGLQLADIDVIESNEAFAAQACAVSRTLGFDPAKVNPNGSGIALGHPVGATGTILTVKAMYELHRAGARYALITMCIGGGQGIALVIERT